MLNFGGKAKKFGLNIGSWDGGGRSFPIAAKQLRTLSRL